MNSETSQDFLTQSIAVASIRRSAMKIEHWQHTTIADLHPELTPHFCLQAGELALASGYFSKESWWVISTRRIISMRNGAIQELDPRNGISHTFGDFKAVISSEETMATKLAIATIRGGKTAEAIQLEFESGYASMAPIKACLFWSRASGFHTQPNLHPST
jgi:hypothetical protein